MNPENKTEGKSFRKEHLIKQREELSTFVQRARSKSHLEFKFLQIWKLVTSPFNLMLAYAQIHKNKGSLTMGVDELTPDGIGTEYIQQLRNDLLSQTYKHKAIKRVEIPKPGSHKTRPLGIPTFRDRIVQAAVKNILEAI